jgi:hypothetical protein
MSKNKILRDDHVLCHLVLMTINKHEFRFFFAKWCHDSVKLDLLLHTTSDKNPFI